VTILAKGTLCHVDTELPKEALGNFETTYCFKGNIIEVKFTFDAKVEQITMVYAGEADVKVETAAMEEALDTYNQELYFTPHGRLAQGKRWTGTGNVWTYFVKLV
jgi:hypothetical protein